MQKYDFILKCYKCISDVLIHFHTFIYDSRIDPCLSKWVQHSISSLSKCKKSKKTPNGTTQCNNPHFYKYKTLSVSIFRIQSEFWRYPNPGGTIQLILLKNKPIISDWWLFISLNHYKKLYGKDIGCLRLLERISFSLN